MKSSLFKTINSFGLLKGLSLYPKLKRRKSGWFIIPQSSNKVYLRGHTSDHFTYKQVFIENQYNITLPFQPQNIIDAGANVGLAAVFFAERYRDSNIVAIEPDKRNFESILKNTGTYKNISALQKGLWNADTNLEIIDANVNENAFMVRETPTASETSIESISVESIMRQKNWTHIDILKIDIEGSEKEVFERNYEYWLPRTRAIYLELHDDMRAGATESVLSAIRKYNFSVSENYENKIFFNKGFTGS